LYDVFVNIRNDEAEHCKTMRACQTAGKTFARSPYSVATNEDVWEVGLRVGSAFIMGALFLDVNVSVKLAVSDPDYGICWF
jgi:hypothetical protein